MSRSAFFAPFPHRFFRQFRVTRNCPVHPHHSSVRASAVSNRRTALSILAGTSALSAFAGGPSLVAWSALFGVTGAVTEAPMGLVYLAAGMCAALTDLIAFNIGYSPFDKGILPFLVFAAGGTVAGTLDAFGGDIDEYLTAGKKENVIKEPTQPDGEFTAWDGELRKREGYEPDQ